jgi:hypothetical protein
MKSSRIHRPILATLSFIILFSASAIAGPVPRFVMIDGVMCQITPMSSDVTLKNGCKVCTYGAIIGPDGTVTKLHEGDFVSSSGARMSPSALHLHGG